MKKIITFLIILFMLFPLFAQTVYIGGSYLENGQQKASYITDGVMTKIDGVRIDAITVKNGIVYAAGIYREVNNSRIYQYWIDGIPHELPFCTSVTAIYVDNGNVYVHGSEGNYDGSSYWINGRRNFWPDNSHGGYMNVVNGTFYFTGLNPATRQNPSGGLSYFVNGARTNLVNSSNFIAFGIEVVNSIIYVGAYNNQTRQLGYWVNGRLNIINNAPNEIYYLFVSNSDVYILSRGQHYWVNGNRHTYQTPGLSAHWFTVSNGKIYSIGHCHRHRQNQIPCYWVDDEHYELNGFFEERFTPRAIFVMD